VTEKLTARRNSLHKPGEEVLVLRHQKLKKGYHPSFIEASKRGVWLAYEKIGARVVFDYKVIHPEGGGSPDYDENYRLARYASYEHWEETRRPMEMMGDGPLLDLLFIGGIRRRNYILDTDGAYIMTGRMIEDLPYHLSGLQEDFEISEDGSDDASPVRYNIPVPGDEMAELSCWKIKKGSFDKFDSLTRQDMLPVMSKMGVRGIGIWQLIYPETAIGEQSGDYDEVMMVSRYASYEHWQACKEPMRLIGDGPDYKAWADASSKRDALIQDGWHRFLQGEMYNSPPTYIPTLKETYKRS
jgi:hypothetical protein